MQTFELRLNEKYFNSIKQGTKTIEMRLFDEKRQQYNVGDILIFKKRPDEKEILQAKIINLHKANSFADLYKKFNKVKLGYSETESANPEDMLEFYSAEDQQKYGVIGIEIALL